MTVAAVLTALLLAALLNGPSLVATATGLEVGMTRTVAVRLASLVETTGTLLRLDGPGRWMFDLHDQGLKVLRDPAGGDGWSAPVTTSPPEGMEDAAAGTAPPEVATREHDRARRAVSAAEPLEVFLVGDSLIGTIADGFGRVTDGRESVGWTKEIRISTGLARPDVLDWHGHIEQLLTEDDPDVLVLMLGGNDDQSLTGAPDGILHLGQDGWGDEYERRVRELLAIAAGGDRLVVWLGLPAMRPDKLERARPTMRTAAERAIADSEAVLLDTEPIVSPDGYTPRLDGVQVRADDGVHLTHVGGDLVAAHLDRLLRDRYDLPEG